MFCGLTAGPAYVLPSKRPEPGGANDPLRPLALGVSDLPQDSIAQGRGIAFPLLRKGDNPPGEGLPFAFVFVSLVENRAEVAERLRHRLDVPRPESAIL